MINHVQLQNTQQNNVVFLYIRKADVNCNHAIYKVTLQCLLVLNHEVVHTYMCNCTLRHQPHTRCTWVGVKLAGRNVQTYFHNHRVRSTLKINKKLAKLHGKNDFYFKSMMMIPRQSREKVRGQTGNMHRMLTCVQPF